MVALADRREPLLELRQADRAAELALENDDVFVAEAAPPGGGGEALRVEVVGGGADFRELVDVGVVG